MKALTLILILTLSFIAQNQIQPANEDNRGAKQQTEASENVKISEAISQNDQPPIEKPPTRTSNQPNNPNQDVTDNTAVWVGIALNALLFLVVIGQGYISKRQLDAMERQTKLAADTLDHNRSSFHSTERAYLGITSVKIISPIAVNSRAAVGFMLLNAGRTPAWNVRAEVRMIIHRTSLDKIVKEHPVDMSTAARTGIFLPAGAERLADFPEVTILITSGQMHEINTGSAKLGIYGEVHYLDFMDAPQIFYIRAEYRPSTKGFIELDVEPATQI